LKFRCCRAECRVFRSIYLGELGDSAVRNRSERAERAISEQRSSKPFSPLPSKFCSPRNPVYKPSLSCHWVFNALRVEHELHSQTSAKPSVLAPHGQERFYTMAENKTDLNWHELYKEASEERDPRKLLELLREINQALAEQRTRRAEVNRRKETRPQPIKEFGRGSMPNGPWPKSRQDSYRLRYAESAAPFSAEFLLLCHSKSALR